MRAGDVILFKTKFHLLKPMSWLSSLIRLFTKSKYNHVGLFIESCGEMFLIEAIGKGVIVPVKVADLEMSIVQKLRNKLMPDGLEAEEE